MDWSKVALMLWWVVLTMYYATESLVLMFVPRKYRTKSLRGNVVVVTGGGSGIGRLMCLKLAAKGAIIVTWDVSEKSNQETARMVQASGHQCRAYTVDLSDRQAIYATAEKVKREVGKVDILINNAGIVTGKILLECPDASIIKTFEVNTLAHFWTTKAFLPDMMVRNTGHIVTISSILGKTPINSLVDYCSSKYAAVGFDEALRIELKALGKFGIKTTVACPGLINTGMFDGITNTPSVEPDQVAEEVVSAVELNETVLYVPYLAKIHLIAKTILPEKSFFKMLEFLGATTAMDKFIGRHKTK